MDNYAPSRKPPRTTRRRNRRAIRCCYRTAKHRHALRSKGASYHAIARNLDTVKIRVSLDSLSRFCREAIEQKPERKSPRSSGTASAPGRAETPLSETASPHAASDSPVLANEANTTEPAAPPRGKGPRIADPTDI